jgi:hypothetical protein
MLPELQWQIDQNVFHIGSNFQRIRLVLLGFWGAPIWSTLAGRTAGCGSMGF